MPTKTLLQIETKKKLIVQLESSLKDLKELLGEKKFTNRVEKAASLLSKGIGKVKKGATTTPKKEEKTAVPAKKVVAKKAVANKVPVSKKAAAPVKKNTKSVVKAK